MNDIYEHKAKKYKYKYLKLKNQNGGYINNRSIYYNNYYKPFGLYGLHGHIIKNLLNKRGEHIKFVNVLNKRERHIKFIKTNKNPKLSNIEINYIHELPIYDSNDVNFIEDNIIIKHLLENCKEGEYYKDVKSFTFIPYKYDDEKEEITDKEKYEIQNLIDTSYFTDEINRNKNEEFKIDREEEEKKEEEEKREKESFERLKELETKIYEKIIKEHKREGEIEQLIEEIKINERKKEEEIERERERERKREEELIKQIKEKERKEESIRKAREGETEWLSLNKYKKGRHRGLSDYLSRQYVDNFSSASTKILDSESYIIKKLPLIYANEEKNKMIDEKNEYRKNELNLQKERTCINLYSKPTIYKPPDDYIPPDDSEVLLKDELIEKDNKQYLLSDFNLGNILKFNSKISKDSYIYNRTNLGYSGYNIMINKATINCIARHHDDMIFPIRIILDMNPGTLFYDNIYERTFLKFINEKLKKELKFNDDILEKLLSLVKDNKKIDVRPRNAIPDHILNKYNVELEINKIEEINSKNLYNINKLINMLIHKKYSNLDILLKLLFKLLETDILELETDIITLFNYIFKIYFNKEYKYLGFWILKFKNNYTDKEIKENDMSNSRPHNSREQYYVFFMFKYIQFETLAPVFKYPIVNFRNNKIESGGVVELKKILYHEILQLLCSYYNNNIFFYIILKKKSDKDQEKECNLQGEYFTNKKHFFNCTNNWFTYDTETYFTNKKIYIEDDKIDILISKHNIESLIIEMDRKKSNKLLNINNLELIVTNDEKYILLNEEYCLYECYFDYEKSLDEKSREQFVIKLGNLNDEEKDALKKDACIYEKDLDRFYFEDMRRTIAAKFNVFNSDEIEKFYNPIKIQDL
jgi:hypothetical protein